MVSDLDCFLFQLITSGVVIILEGKIVVSLCPVTRIPSHSNHGCWKGARAISEGEKELRDSSNLLARIPALWQKNACKEVMCEEI